MADLIDGWAGDLTIRGFATRTLRDYRDNRVNPPEARAGAQSPKWKYNASIRCSMEPYTVSLAFRGRSSGKQNTAWVECTSGCPVSNVTNITINQNYRDATFYTDVSFAYDLRSFEEGGSASKPSSTSRMSSTPIRRAIFRDPAAAPSSRCAANAVTVRTAKAVSSVRASVSRGNRRTARSKRGRKAPFLFERARAPVYG
ncbi:MAG: hypothetical protein AB7E79_08550 [Rhodospirillaceae bacterium]